MNHLPFESVTLKYKDAEFIVDPDRVWGLIRTITSVVGITKLSSKLMSHDTDDVLFCEAYAAALRYASDKNQKVTGQDVYFECDGGDYFVDLGLELFNILKIAMPKKPVKVDPNEPKEEKKTE